MEGNRKRFKFMACNEWRKRPRVWKLMKNGNVIGLLESLHGCNPSSTRMFNKEWRNGSMNICGRNFTIDEGVIVAVTGLLTDGLKFYTDRKTTRAVVKHFPKEEDEREKLVNVNKNYFSLGVLKMYGDGCSLPLCTISLWMVGSCAFIATILFFSTTTAMGGTGHLPFDAFRCSWGWFRCF